MIRERGFTTIELIIVVVLMGLVFAIGGPSIADSLSKDELQRFSEESADALRQAQSSAMSGVNAARHGVHFETTKFVSFEGATYSAGDSDNLEHDFSGLVTITNITITGGGSEIIFASHKGIPVETGTIELTDVEGFIRVVSINTVGMIEQQLQ